MIDGEFENKDYFDRMYKLGVLDWKLARSTEERQKALDELFKLYNLAGKIYGLDFADSLQAKYPCSVGTTES